MEQITQEAGSRASQWNNRLWNKCVFPPTFYESCMYIQEDWCYIKSTITQKRASLSSNCDSYAYKNGVCSTSCWKIGRHCVKIKECLNWEQLRILSAGKNIKLQRAVGKARQILLPFPLLQRDLQRNLTASTLTAKQTSQIRVVVMCIAGFLLISCLEFNKNVTLCRFGVKFRHISLHSICQR